MKRNIELGSPEDFRQEAAHNRKWAKESGRAAVLAAGLSGTLGTLGVMSFMEGGLNVVNGVIASGVAVGMGVGSRTAMNDAINSSATAMRYEQMAAQDDPSQTA